MIIDEEKAYVFPYVEQETAITEPQLSKRPSVGLPTSDEDRALPFDDPLPDLLPDSYPVATSATVTGARPVQKPTASALLQFKILLDMLSAPDGAVVKVYEQPAMPILGRLLQRPSLTFERKGKRVNIYGPKPPLVGTLLQTPDMSITVEKGAIHFYDDPQPRLLWFRERPSSSLVFRHGKVMAYDGPEHPIHGRLGQEPAMVAEGLIQQGQELEMG